MKREAVWKLLEAGSLIRETFEEAFAPSDAMRHFRASRAEALKGVRALLDAEIGKLEKSGTSTNPGEEAGKRSSNRKIEIDD
ncbi:hypothetical protein [Paenibacillus flagellatus]|uniref:Uncharacterized protein n=1 Tax=Paenibacillus flagellatus TaxID=2211139 RepID=A0A2V5K2N9_9BACL|nr:hypothetical protein [Paenibacillus flagellatus]PYI53468.1 hypothetical protein DLM86_16985 [Paenibacillus flagellatus]